MRLACTEEFPVDAHKPVSRKVLNVWQGRRLQILPDPIDALAVTPEGGSWLTGRLVELSQSNMGPFDVTTRWSMTVTFDDAAAARASPALARVREARAEAAAEEREQQDAMAARYGRDGQRGKTIAKAKAIDNTFIADGSGAAATAAAGVEAAEAELGLEATTLEFSICKCSVDGGGTFHKSSNTLGKRISFRWLEAAELRLNVHGGVSCPVCRTIQAPYSARAGYEPPPPLLWPPQACGVCLQQKRDGSVLSCGHVVCASCRPGWALANDGRDMFDGELQGATGGGGGGDGVVMDPMEADADADDDAQLESERAACNSELVMTMATVMATGDAAAIESEFQRYVATWMRTLREQATDGGPEGRAFVRRELAMRPMKVLFDSAARTCLTGNKGNDAWVVVLIQGALHEWDRELLHLRSPTSPRSTPLHHIPPHPTLSLRRDAHRTTRRGADVLVRGDARLSRLYPGPHYRRGRGAGPGGGESARVCARPLRGGSRRHVRAEAVPCRRGLVPTQL